MFFSLMYALKPEYNQDETVSYSTISPQGDKNFTLRFIVANENPQSIVGMPVTSISFLDKA